MAEKITEEMKLHKKWFEEAKKQTVETLPEFVRHLVEDYEHDYGTIYHAVGAAGLAGMYAVENSPTGGITGFQAGFCLWDVIRQWNYLANKCGLAILDYDKLLYPQNQDAFTTVSSQIMENVRTEAQNNIDKFNQEYANWVESHAVWERQMEKFKVEVVEWQKEHSEYPTYEENPSFYQHLEFGNADEWEMERKKEESGFMFEPREPYEPSVHPDVMSHWKMLVDGGVPFGLKVVED